MRHRSLLVAAAVVSAATAGLLIVQLSQEASGPAALLQKQKLDLVNADNYRDVVGNYYAVVGDDANLGLGSTVAAGKAEVERQRQEMVANAIRQGEIAVERMQDACHRNPSLPGCDDVQSNIPEYATPLEPADAGDKWYAYVAEDTKDRLADNVEDGVYQNKMTRYLQDVQRYVSEIAAKDRFEDACRRNPALPGCKMPMVVKQPSWPQDGADPNIYYYAATADDSKRFLDNEMRQARLQDRADRAEQAYEAALQAAAAQSRWADACLRNPSLPGCGGGWVGTR